MCKSDADAASSLGVLVSWALNGFEKDLRLFIDE
jgi:hypothetical protein